MAEKTLKYKDSTLHYEITGTGSRALLMFHGFGQNLHIFKTISASLSDIYTLYIFDLYFHGKSQWGYGEAPLEKHHWNETIQAFIDTYRLEKFSLAGYSLGGKFVLATVEAFPQKIESVYLLAPDGIKTSFWFSLATYPILFRRLFKSMIRHHERFMTISEILLTLRLLNKGLIRFAGNQMNTEEKRERVYYSWVVFRKLRFNLDELAAIFNTNQIPLTLITGKYDKVIPPGNMKRLVKRLKNVDFKVLESGHNGLIAESIAYLR